jgi:hypothetical protein
MSNSQGWVIQTKGASENYGLPYLSYITPVKERYMPSGMMPALFIIFLF